MHVTKRRQSSGSGFVMRNKKVLLVASAVLASAALGTLAIEDADQVPPTSRAPATQATSAFKATSTPESRDTSSLERDSRLAGNPWDHVTPRQEFFANNSAVARASMHASAASRQPLTAEQIEALESPRISSRLAALAQGSGARLIEVFVQHDQHPSASQEARIAMLGGQVLRTYENFPFMAVLIPANKLAELSRAGDVSFMDVNARVEAASAAARQTAYVPYSGSGTSFPVSSSIGVAVVDSGVSAHADLNVVERVAFNDARSSFFGDMFDGFNDFDYRESYGRDSWSQTPWIELNDDATEQAGKIRIQTGNCPYATWETCLEFSANSSTTTTIERRINVIGAREMWMTFEHELKNVTSTAAFVLEASKDGGLTWSVVQTFNTVGSNLYNSVNLTPYIAAATKVRFRVTDTDPTATLSVDFLQVAYRSSTYYRDTFDTTNYNASTGNEAWPAAWSESGDGTTSPSAGTITIGSHASCPNTTGCLRIDAAGGVNDSVTRALNLSGVFGAMLSFDYRMVTGTNPGRIVVEASKDSGASWTQLGSMAANEQNWGVRYDLTPFATANARIRFRVATAATGSILRIDNLEINVERGDANDNLGHGTHIAGIIGGKSGSAGMPGVARNARIHQVRVLDGRGRGTVADLIAGLDWIYTNGAARGIKVVNLSLGTGVTQSAATDPLVIAAERLWDAGFVVVASAGNFGIFGNMTITSPGTARKIITVGSLNDFATGTNFNDDFVSLFSSRGPTMIDHVLKPDLIAPGNLYVSTVGANSRLRTALPALAFNCSTNCGGTYMRLSGTSMAAAQVSGAVLLMLSKEPTLSPSTVKARLMRSARKISGSDPTATGAGVLNVQAALNETGHLSGQALSPRMQRSAEGSAIMVEDTASLWNNSTFGAGYLWQNGYLWSNNYSSASGYLWSDGYLWQNGYLWSNGYLWNNGYLWQNGYLWSDGYLWDEAVDGTDLLGGASVYGLMAIPD
jgi:hypothetical protein